MEFSDKGLKIDTLIFGDATFTPLEKETLSEI